MAPTLSGRSGGKLEEALEFVLRISGVFAREAGRAARLSASVSGRSHRRARKKSVPIRTNEPRSLGLMRRHAAAVLPRPTLPLTGCFVPEVPIPICHKPCVTWARGQPDFQFSYDACVAQCRAEMPGSQFAAL